MFLRYMPYVMVAESLLLIFLQKTLFRGLRTENMFMRLYDFASAILAPKENEANQQQQDGVHGNLLDQRQLMYYYKYFLTELRNTFAFKVKCIRDSAIILTMVIGVLMINITSLHMLSLASR